MDDQHPQLDRTFRDPANGRNTDAVDCIERRCTTPEISDVLDAEGLGRVQEDSLGREYFVAQPVADKKLKDKLMYFLSFDLMAVLFARHA
jgi:hypothetical protein